MRRRRPHCGCRPRRSGSCRRRSAGRCTTSPDPTGVSRARASCTRPQRSTRRRRPARSEEHTSELQSPCNLVCRLLLEKKKKVASHITSHLKTCNSYYHTPYPSTIARPATSLLDAISLVKITSTRSQSHRCASHGSRLI